MTSFVWRMEYFFVIFAHPNGKTMPIGRLAEWLGSGLQNRVRRFESATDLNLRETP